MRISNYPSDKIIEESIDQAEGVTKKTFKDDLLSFLPEVEIKQKSSSEKDSETEIQLQIIIRVAPFTPKVGREKEIVEKAANAFFRSIKKLITSRKKK